MPSWDSRQESAGHSARETDQEIKVCFAHHETMIKTPCFAFCSYVWEINGIFSRHWEICWDIQNAIANIFGEFIVNESETYDLNYHKNRCLEFNENGLWQIDTECHQRRLETDWGGFKDHSQRWHLRQPGCIAELSPNTVGDVVIPQLLCCLALKLSLSLPLSSLPPLTMPMLSCSAVPLGNA